MVVDRLDVAVVRDETDAVDGEDGRDDERHGDAQRDGGDPGDLRPGVRAIVDAAQPATVHVAVDLRRRERAVPEQLLDHAQVGAALEEVRGERVTQAVRVRG